MARFHIHLQSDYQRSFNVDVINRGSIVLGLLTSLLVSGVTPVIYAQTPAPFPANPLELTEPDPLLPQPVVSRPLSPQEVRLLSQALDRLNAQATVLFKAGKKEEAFKVWNRELRLRRFLGPQVEVPALGRVGDIAWRESETTQVRLITERLLTIQKENRAALFPDIGSRLTLKRSLGTAFLQVRNKAAAISVYQEILADARQRRDIASEGTALTTIATQYLNWFDYIEAAAAYRELLALMRANPKVKIIPYTPPASLSEPEKPEPDPEPLRDVDVLGQLAYIYEQNKQPEEAIEAQQELILAWQRRKNPAPIPALKLAISNNLLLLNRMDLAVVSYQETYTLAQSLQQYGYAADALKRLGELYTASTQWDAALRIYQFLLDVERQSYNTYGQMMAYEQIGRIHQARQDAAQAIAAYQQGLEIARQLKYRETYFINQITQLTQPPSQPASDPEVWRSLPHLKR